MQSLQEGVLVKATDGSYVETLQTEGNSSTVFVGAGDMREVTS